MLMMNLNYVNERVLKTLFKFRLANFRVDSLKANDFFVPLPI